MMAITWKIEVGINSNFLHSISTSIMYKPVGLLILIKIIIKLLYN